MSPHSRRSRRAKLRSRKAGLPPGTPVHIGERTHEHPLMSVTQYDEVRLTERTTRDVVEIAELRKAPGLLWINVDAVHDVELIEHLGRLFHLHPLVIEDIANTDQRPKLEDYGDHIFIVLKMLSYDIPGRQILAEQVSLVLTENTLLTFGEREGDVFDPVRDRIRHSKGRIRRLGADYLAYSLLDAVVDHYFEILEKLGEQMEELEDRILDQPTRNLLTDIYRIKSELLFLRKSVWPLREVLLAIAHSDSSLIKGETGLYARDVYDHTVQVIDTLENYRDLLTGMLDVHLSVVSYRTNVVMRVLTVIATVFMPLTFLAGIWGMNFTYMPELSQPWGYPAALLLMMTLGAGMLLYFKRKGWM